MAFHRSDRFTHKPDLERRDRLRTGVLLTYFRKVACGVHDI